MRISHWLLSAAIAVGAAGCSKPDVAAYDYRVRHPLVVEPQSATSTAAAGDWGALDAAAQDYVRRGNGPFTLSMNVAEESEAAAKAASSAAQRVLAGGVPTDQMRLQLIVDPSAEPGSVVLEYRRVIASVPSCPDWSQASGHDNEIHSNYGCSVQTNIGAMVSNPADLLRGQPYVGREAVRAGDVYGKWSTGGETSGPSLRTYSTSGGG